MSMSKSSSRGARARRLTEIRDLRVHEIMKYENDKHIDRPSYRPSNGQRLGVYEGTKLPPQSSAPAGAYVINRTQGNARFAVEMAISRDGSRQYLGFFDPNS